MTEQLQQIINSDWQKNWGASIAVKVTAPVLWIVIVVGLIVATVIQNNFASNLKNMLNADADRLAYVASRYLVELEGGQPLELAETLEQHLPSMKFFYGEITVGPRKITFGKRPAGTAHLEHIVRDVQYTNKLENGDALRAKLALYHPPTQRIIKDERKNFLVKIGAPLLVFGMLLASFIHLIVTKPIFQLLRATKSVSEGDLSLRIQNHRQDEFGQLTEFFNQMLDKLQNKQEELSLAVDVAESASNAKSAFLANMSHEIRTPLTAIMGFSGLLTDYGLGKQERKQHVESIHRAGMHLQQIINDILDMSKIEAGQLVIERIFTSPFDIVREVEELMSMRATDKNLKFRVHYKFPLPKSIYTDPTRLKQVLLNLCSNAIKFTEDGNIDIYMEYYQPQQKLQFDVTDTGIGMTVDELNRLFKPFSQADTSTTRQFGGTGLGLCISKELATSLGGDIVCQSRKGIGSKFSLTINAGDITSGMLISSLEDSGLRPTQELVSIKPNSLSGKVLLAEDTPDNQKLISMYIRRTGAEAVVVGNGIDAVDKALTADFDLIIMDMQMPIMGGVEATVRLRATGYKKPIVALTANALKEDREKCQRAGVDDYLTKPVELNRFNNVLKTYLKIKPVTPNMENRIDYSDSQAVSVKTDNLFVPANLDDDPEFRQLVDKFENELEDRIENINIANNNANWGELKSLVHKLKGCGANFGYQEISDICSTVQNEIVSENYQNVAPMIVRLNAYVEQIRVSKQKRASLN